MVLKLANDLSVPFGGRELRYFAKAKVNLALKVLGLRPDGYHELDSLMAQIDLADRISLRFNNDLQSDKLKVLKFFPDDLGSNFEGPGNLILRAIDAFRQRSNWPEAGLEVFLEKYIPPGSGLGGGSADCACVLNVLNRAAPKPLLEADLLQLGLSLGADVPFCLSGLTLARAKGVGEKLSAPPSSFEKWHGRRLILLKAPLNISTKEVFKKLGLTNAAANNNLVPGVEIGPGDNDLLKALLALKPSLHEITESLTQLGLKAWGLSGSGPTFWIYDANISCEKLAKIFPACWIESTLIS